LPGQHAKGLDDKHQCHPPALADDVPKKDDNARILV
jgi:hypothetical protein